MHLSRVTESATLSWQQEKWAFALKRLTARSTEFSSRMLDKQMLEFSVQNRSG